MQEMSINLGDQIRDIVLSMQSNGSIPHRTTSLEETTDFHKDDEKPAKSEMTADSFGHWSNGDATAIHQHKIRSSLHE